MREQFKQLVKSMFGSDNKMIAGAGAKQGVVEPNIGQVYVFIRSWNRPSYLWACLDSLYRLTQYPCRFVLIDNQSSVAEVKNIIQGFERRELFAAVHYMDQNSQKNQNLVYFRYRAQMGQYFVVLDADITVQASEPCWLTQLINIAENNKNLAILGSLINQVDFIDPQWVKQLASELSTEQITQLIKTNSPERRILALSQSELITPYDPAGRLLLLRTAAIDQFGLQMGNKRLCEAATAAGYDVGIASQVRHRHLSLQNFFDYPDYDFDALKAYLRGT